MQYPFDSEPWRWSAVQLAAAIRQRRLTAREATISTLGRIADMNPVINAYTEVLAQEALDAADAADRAVAEGRDLGCLHGVPVSIKINVDQAGKATTNGVPALRDHIAREDAPLVSHWRQSGAIIVGRSNTPMYSSRWFTENLLHGRTLNPWDAEVTPGGSSGGAAAALALGMCAVGHGNDLGGSIRYPAFCCGVAGLRPTRGRVPAYNPSSAVEHSITPQLMSVQGCLARTVADLRLGLEAMAKPDPRDPDALPMPMELPIGPGPLRVALFRQSAEYKPDPAVAQALDAANWLRQAGYEVEEAAPPHFDEAAALWRILVQDDSRRNILAGVARSDDEAMKISRRNMVWGLVETDRDGYLDALTRRHALLREWSMFLHKHPLLLLPVSWRVPALQGEDQRPPEIAFELIRAQSPLLATAMLELPALSIPTGIHKGVPVGVQLVAWRFREDLLLRAGEAIESGAAFLPLFDRPGADSRFRP